MYDRLSFIQFVARRERRLNAPMPAVKEGAFLDRKILNEASAQSILMRIVGFDHALMGGFALGHHGYSRATTDVDVLVHPHDAEQVAHMLGLTNLRPLTIGGIAGTTTDGTEVDLVAPDWPWVPDALADARGTRVLSKPYMVIAKLWAARGGNDDNDVYQIIKRMTPPEKVATKKLVRKYLPNDVEDFQAMLGYADHF